MATYNKGSGQGQDTPVRVVYDSPVRVVEGLG